LPFERNVLLRTRTTLFCTSTIGFAIALGGCNNTITGSPNYLSVIIAPRPASIPVGTSVVFTGTVSNNLSLPQWSLLDSAETSNPGTLTPVPGAPDSILYTAPPTPPVYTQTVTGITQGTVTLNVTVTDPPGTSTPITPDSITFVVTAPSVTVGLAPLTASVSLGGTQQFFGYAVGSLNNALTWEVNGIPGGSSAVGTINVGGTYVAPPTMPMSGSTVTITIVSQADPTKTMSATVTLH
jgi:hypothetical protein